MKPGEKMAYDYLASKGYLIEYEPIPNRPPDLLLNGEVAVEVTRLSQFSEGDAGAERLELLEFQLMARVRPVLRSYPPIDKQHFFVSFEYRRPLKLDKSFAGDLKRILDLHIANHSGEAEYVLYGTLKIRIRPSRRPQERTFTLGSYSDSDGGGFVIGNIIDALQRIIPEKHAKIEPFRHLYPRWWLAVNDHIGFGLDETDLAQIRTSFNTPTFFERIIFISAFNSADSAELILENKHNLIN